MSTLSRGTAALLCMFPLATALAQSPIDDLQPGHWVALPDTMIRSVAPDPNIDGFFIADVSKIMTAWSGGTFDPAGNRFFIKGGGHGSYGGNEIYAYDIDTQELSRIWGPSPFAGWKDGDTLMPDGAPVAAHSNDYIQYIPSTGEFCTFTNMATWHHKLRWDKTSYCLDFATGEWRAIAQMPKGGNYMFSAYDPLSGHVFVHGGGGLQWLKEYDPIANTWTSRGNNWTDSDFWFGDGRTAAIDPDRRLFAALGRGELIVWDISGSSGDVSGQLIATTGDTEIEDAQGPGFVHDPINGVYVAWDGGSDVYVLDPEDWSWTRFEAAPTNTVTPTSTAGTFGTYGRFQYIPSKNAFIAVASVDETMFAYKLDLSPPAPDTTPPTAPSGLTAIVQGSAQVDLSWLPSEDPETGIQRYDIYRDGTVVGTTGATSFSDTGLIAGSTYEYFVTAVNFAQLTSDPSELVSVTTEADLDPPTVVSVVAIDATTLMVTFNEALDPASATNPANYSLDANLTVVSVALEEDGRTVTLTTTPHGQYLLTVDGVQDEFENAAAGDTEPYAYP